MRNRKYLRRAFLPSLFAIKGPVSVSQLAQRTVPSSESCSIYAREQILFMRILLPPIAGCFGTATTHVNVTITDDIFRVRSYLFCI